MGKKKIGSGKICWAEQKFKNIFGADFFFFRGKKHPFRQDSDVKQIFSLSEKEHPATAEESSTKAKTMPETQKNTGAQAKIPETENLQIRSV